MGSARAGRLGAEGIVAGAAGPTHLTGGSSRSGAVIALGGCRQLAGGRGQRIGVALEVRLARPDAIERERGDGLELTGVALEQLRKHAGQHLDALGVECHRGRIEGSRLTTQQRTDGAELVGNQLERRLPVLDRGLGLCLGRRRTPWDIARVEARASVAAVPKRIRRFIECSPY